MKSFWFATANMEQIRDIEELFSTRNGAENYVESEILRCDWELTNIDKEATYTDYFCNSCDGKFILSVYQVPFTDK